MLSHHSLKWNYNCFVFTETSYLSIKYFDYCLVTDYLYDINVSISTSRDKHVVAESIESTALNTPS